ncbi:uncharacterized protein LOC144106516 [Amblyomma americanum]
MSSGKQKKLCAHDVDDLVVLEYCTSSDEECTPVPDALESTQDRQAGAHSLKNLSAFAYDSSSDDENVEPENRAQIRSWTNCADSDSDNADPPVQPGNTAGQNQELRSSARQSSGPNATSTYAPWNLALIDFNYRQNPVGLYTPPEHSRNSYSNGSNSDTSHGDGSTSGRLSGSVASSSKSAEGRERSSPVHRAYCRCLGSYQSTRTNSLSAAGEVGLFRFRPSSTIHTINNKPGPVDVATARNKQGEQLPPSSSCARSSAPLTSFGGETGILRPISQDEMLASSAARRLPGENSTSQCPVPCPRELCQPQTGTSPYEERIAALEAACIRHTEALCSLNTTCDRLSECVIAMENAIQHSIVLLKKDSRGSLLDKVTEQLKSLIAVAKK